MEEILKSLEPIGILVTALATIVLAYVTYVLSKETKRLASLGSQPQVVFTVEPGEFEMSFLDYEIQNVGTATAYDISLRFYPSLSFNTKGQAARHPPPKISLLKPGQKFSGFLSDYSDLETRTFQVTASWACTPKGKVEESLSYTIDLTLLEGVMRLGTPPAKSIAQSLEKLTGLVERIARSAD